MAAVDRTADTRTSLGLIAAAVAGIVVVVVAVAGFWRP